MIASEFLVRVVEPVPESKKLHHQKRVGMRQENLSLPGLA
jgi:hypothetical protein